MQHSVKTMGIAGITAAAIVLSFGAVAQSAFKGYQPGEWAKIVAEAKKEGKVVVYSTAPPPPNDRLRVEFEKLNPGIKVEVTRIVGTELVSKLDVERSTNADGADFAITAEIGWVGARSRENALKTPVGPASQAWPARHVIANTSPILAVEPFVLLYNTNLVKTPVTSYDDLLRPEFKGKLAAPDLATTIFMAFYEWLEQTRGPAFLPKLAAQSPRFFASGVQSTQLIAAGELMGSAHTVPTIVTPLVAQGAPIRMVVPNPGMGVPYAGTLPASAKRPNAAQVFLDFIMTPAGQTTWAVNGEVASALPNIPKALDMNTTLAVDPTKFTPEVANAYRAKWEKIFK